MAITVFDGVGKFTADSSQLDQFIVKLEQGLTGASEKAAASTRVLKEAQLEFREAIRSVTAEGGATAENMQRLADAEKNLTLATAAAKQEHNALRDSIGEGKGAMREFGGASHEAKGALALLGEEMGIHIPRHLRSFIVELPGVKTLLASAFAPVAILALIEVGGKLIEKIQEIRNHAKEVEEAWQKVEDGAEAAMRHTDDEILKVEAQLDVLNHDKLGALEKQLELLDHSSLENLAKQLQQIQKDTDEAFAKMKTWWDWLQTLGEGNRGIEKIKGDFDDTNKKLQNLLKFGEEHPDPFGTVAKSLDNAKQHLVQLQEQQAKATGEQKALVDEEVAAQQRRISMLELLQTKGAAAQSELNDLERQHLELTKQIEETDQIANSEFSQGAAVQLEILEKKIEAQKQSNKELGNEVLLLGSANKLFQEQVDLALKQNAKKEGGENGIGKALLDAQKNVGAAIIELLKAQGIEQVEQVEKNYSLQNATTKEAFAEQLELIAQAELRKQAIQAKADDDQYQLQLKLLDAQLAELKKSGKDTEKEQIAINAEIEKLHFAHQAKILEISAAGMAALRKTMSQPIPLINEVPAGMEQIDNEITKGFREAEAAAAELGITLQSKLDTSLQATFDNYARLDKLFKQGIITQHDLDKAQKQVIQSELQYALATGATEKTIEKLKAQLRDIINQEIAWARATHASTQAIQALEKELAQLDNKGKKSLKDFTSELQHDMQAGADSLTLLKDTASSMMGQLTLAVGDAFAAMITGQESFGEAMIHSTEKMIGQLAQQWAMYFAAKGIADIFWDPALGAAELAAAVALEAVAGVMNALGSASSSKSSTTSTGTPEPAAGSPATTAGAAPSQGRNTTHLAAGGVAMEPTPAVVGDDQAQPTRGAAEAILPLDDRRSMEMVAAALAPAIAKFMPPGRDVTFPPVHAIATSLAAQPTAQRAPLLSASTLSSATPAAAPADAYMQHYLEAHPAIKMLNEMTHGRFAPWAMQGSGSGKEKPVEVHLKLETDIPHTVKLIAPEMSKQVNNGNVQLLASDSKRFTRRS